MYYRQSTVVPLLRRTGRGRSGVALLILAALCVAPVGGSGIEGSVDVGLLGVGFT